MSFSILSGVLLWLSPIRFNVDGLLRGDYKSRMEGYAIGRQNGWLSANDIRCLEDMNPMRSVSRKFGFFSRKLIISEYLFI